MLPIRPYYRFLLCVYFRLGRCKPWSKGFPFCPKLGIFHLLGQEGIKIVYYCPPVNTLLSSMKHPSSTLTFATPCRS